MKEDRIEYNLIARYIAGESSSQEEEYIRKWARKNRENKQLLQEFKRIWNASEGDPESFIRETGALENWKNLKRRLGDEKQTKAFDSKVDSVNFNPSNSSLHRTTAVISRVAAVLLLAGLIGWFLHLNLSTPTSEEKTPVLREISTSNAQRASMTLGDGTEVMLNADSKITLPDQFEADIREVFLQGEAYFKVDSEPDRPFIIHSSGSLIRVLGTSFSVRSYTGDNHVQVVVEEGRVSFEIDNDRNSEKATLTANQMGRFNFEKNIIETKQVQDMQLYLSWKDGYLKFKNAQMNKVGVELERRYGVEVTFSDSEIEEMVLTAFLKSRSIRNVLDVIAKSLDIDYRLEENNVIFIKVD